MAEELDKHIGRTMAEGLMPGAKKKQGTQASATAPAHNTSLRQSLGRALDVPASGSGGARGLMTGRRTPTYGTQGPMPGTDEVRTGSTVGDLLNELPKTPEFMRREKGGGIRVVEKDGVPDHAAVKKEWAEAAIRHIKVSAMDAADNWYLYLPRDVWTDIETCVREAIRDGDALYWSPTKGNLPLKVEEGGE